MSKATGVGRKIFLHDDEIFVVRVGGQADAFALPDGVAMESAMLPDGFAGGIDDGAGRIGDVPFEKILHRHLP